MPDISAPTRRTVYSLNFILATVTALVTYFNTPLLIERGVPESAVGVVFAAAATLSIIFLFIAPKVFARFGNYRSLIGLVGVLIASFALLALLLDTASVIVLFILWSAITTVAYLLLDMILEGATPSEGTTGTTRGIYLSLAQIAWFVAPVVAGLIVAMGSFELLYLVAAAIAVPAFSIARRDLKNLKTHAYRAPQILHVYRMLSQNRDMRLVFSAQFLLRLFYAVMVIYTPVYLIEKLNLSASTFGAIISFAMLAFLLFEWPMGRLADTRYGEKEIMMLGFIIMGIATAFLTFIVGPSILEWGLLLFLTRIGAAMVDITTESYFFKHVNGEDSDVVGVFRILGPLAYIVGPLLGTALLLFLPFSYIFVALGVIMMIGVPVALGLKDTR